MIKMVEESAIQRFEYETSRIVIVKNDLHAVKSTIIEGKTEEEERPVKPAVSSDSVEVQQEIQHEIQQDIELPKITSPTVGTFYSAPQPGEDPFVKIGQNVVSSTVVCVLEAMKLFNEIRAGVDGEIVEILVKEGDFVEFGQPLFLVKKGD